MADHRDRTAHFIEEEQMQQQETKTTATTKPATPVIDRLRATGNWNPNWEPFADLDPAWTEKFMEMGMTPLARGVLDPKTWEFIAIAVDASCTHMYGPGVRRHIRKALELGATKEEIMAVLQSVSVLGIHSMSLGAPILVEELARQSAGDAPAGAHA
jgi:alkylhydroperoxidase/carboxymuconolactone decarboxylase family protein YurZ